MTTRKLPKFEVDATGLAKLIENKGKIFVLHELLQNAWDEETTRVDVTIIKEGRHMLLTVVDDNPDGFADLSHAYTLFADSKKKGNPEKRGRFNFGEKLVLSICKDAMIRSTTGTVYFDANGRRISKSNVRHSGTEFIGKILAASFEIDEVLDQSSRLIPPTGIKTFINNVELPQREPVVSVIETLASEISYGDGVLHKTQRKTVVHFYNAHGEQAYLYEMGIPVVEIEGLFHVNVMQKVPLTLDRDNVPPSFVAKIYALALEHTHTSLDANSANQAWVREAMQTNPDMLSDETIKAVVETRFGDKVVAYDPSDPEANKLAVSQGYTVVHGGTMSGAEWGAVKRANAMLPAGQVTPSQSNTFADANPIAASEWTKGMQRVARFSEWLATETLGIKINVRIINSEATCAATYGSRLLTYNLRRLGHKFFDGDLEKIIDLWIHELGHEFSGDHLSEEYYKALTKIGAKVAMFAMNRSSDFSQFTFGTFTKTLEAA